MSKILILDFGSQFTQLIARRIRELNIFSEIHPCTLSPDNYPELKEVAAVIFSGGPASVSEEGAPSFDKGWLKLGVPVLGICYGMQLLAEMYGGKLEQGASREYGKASLELLAECQSPLFKDLYIHRNFQVWMSHADHVATLPEGFVALAQSKGAPFAAMANESKKLYALQFHPEVVHTSFGKEILKNFLFEIAKIEGTWNSDNFIDHTVNAIKTLIPSENNVICALSGGVDSTVAAVLVNKAIGKRLHCIFVDNGLLREHEAVDVLEVFQSSRLDLQVIKIDARARFLEKLKGVTDPEHKRKIIGAAFIEVFEEEAKKIPNVTHLVQGTLYPDVIESFSVKGPSATIKTHHNVGGLPERMHLKLIEPLRELFKDEVRKVGAALGIPDTLLKRHPFPGPGLAVRILGAITDEDLTLLKKADAIFKETILSYNIYDSIWQSFAVLIPVKSVGVMGDGRTYEKTVALRAVSSEDGMTADWSRLPYELLAEASNRIINEVKGVNRVVYDVSSKPPATIEWE
jgi:GMP synthase (glutamine-hydrolysing)